MEHTFPKIVLILSFFPLSDLTALPFPSKWDNLRENNSYFQPLTIPRYMYVPPKGSGFVQGTCHTPVVM